MENKIKMSKPDNSVNPVNPLNYNESYYHNSKTYMFNIFTLKEVLQSDKFQYGDIKIFYVSYKKKYFKKSYILSGLDNMLRTVLNLSTHLGITVIYNALAYTFKVLGDTCDLIYYGTIAIYKCIVSLDNILP
uniref:Uncharacterized protein n=1 Tax=viral metagenome TaxID=1070528 RepID=A0A6C0H4W6_9ZZZZ